MITEVNVETGKVTERPPTAEEQAQTDADRAAAAAAEQAEKDDQAARAKAEQDWRAAVSNATTLAAVKAALLGTDLPAQAETRIR
jgi:hypothetical protein